MLRKFFGDIEWRNIMNGRTILEEYEIFLQKYNEGVKKYELIHRVKKDKAWKKLKKQRNESNRQQYKDARNEYIRVRREEERNFEKDVVQKSEDEPKLFYKYINGKMKNMETIEKNN
ncbi:hypothetical protein E2C01_051573 [Portunus trituberculatus]|uniref:Uncharacterized protein n=1 Tax=Portunus trituberculatus TaxID=210409 RepID=A0A5B7GBD1_PORTR|nr:hypothetical protein [Portunus trituberculatus]